MCLLAGDHITLKNIALNHQYLICFSIKSLRSATLLNGFKSELTARKEAISNAKTSLETSYAKTLGKTEQQIQEDQGFVNEITNNIAAIESAFNSFNGTIKTIKMSIESGLIFLYICLSKKIGEHNPEKMLWG